MADLRDQIQSEVVKLITKGLEDGSMSEDRARSIAKLILEKLPEDLKGEELLKVLPQLDDEFGELAEIVLPVLVEYEERIRVTVEAKVLDLVRQKKFTEAMEAAKKGIEYSQQLG
jgi:hypothetical protein